MTEQAQQEIFDKWLGQYKALFFKVVRAYASTRMDQEDLFQEIALQVWHSIPSFRQAASVTTWLYRLSLNTAIKWSSKERRHQQASAPLDQPAHCLLDNPLERDERLVWLYEEIARLDEISRALTLLLLEGFSYQEMAGMLGITESNVGVKLNRIKKHLITQSKQSVHHGLN